MCTCLDINKQRLFSCLIQAGGGKFLDYDHRGNHHHYSPCGDSNHHNNTSPIAVSSSSSSLSGHEAAEQPQPPLPQQQQARAGGGGSKKSLSIGQCNTSSSANATLADAKTTPISKTRSVDKGSYQPQTNRSSKDASVYR